MTFLTGLNSELDHGCGSVINPSLNSPKVLGSVSSKLISDPRRGILPLESKDEQPIPTPSAQHMRLYSLASYATAWCCT